MQFGRTYEQIRLAEESPKIVFAWLPIRLTNGRVVWLENVRRRFYRDPSPTWAGDDSHYIYEAIE